MDLHNSDFSGSPCRLQTAALSSASPWGRRQNAFYICFFPSIRRGNTSLEAGGQSLLFEWLMLWTWLALELYFHCSSTKIPAEPIFPVLLYRGISQCFVCEVWSLAKFLFGMRQVTATNKACAR